MSATPNHLHTITRHRSPPIARSFAALPTRHPALPPPRRCASAGAGLVVADLGFDTFLPALGIKPEAAVLTSAVLATGSVFINLVGGLQLEQKRAELQLELERGERLVMYDNGFFFLLIFCSASPAVTTRKLRASFTKCVVVLNLLVAHCTHASMHSNTVFLKFCLF
jgi:hypothetical protein